MKDIIKEIAGSMGRHAYNQPQPQNTPLVHSTGRHDTSRSNITNVGERGIKLSHCHEMKTYQRQAYSLFQRHRDLFMVALPSAGKSLIYTCSWAETILNLNPRMNNQQRSINLYRLFNDEQRRSIPKMLVLVPIINLANRVYAEFIEHFSTVILEHILFILEDLPNNRGRERGQGIAEIIRPLYRYNSNLQRLMNERRFLLTERDTLINSINNRRVGNIDHAKQNLSEINNNIKTIDQMVKKDIANNIKTFIQKELVGMRAGQRDAGGNKNYDKALVTICTYMSSKDIYNKYLRKSNIGMIVFDEAHLLTSLSETGSSDSGGDTAENKCENAYYLMKKASRNTKLIFLSGTINPKSAQNFANYSKKCLGRDIKVHSDNSGSNPSNISILAADWLKDDKKVVDNLLVSPRESNNLLIILSRAKIIELIKHVVDNYPPIYTMQQLSKGMGQKFKHEDKDFGLEREKTREELEYYRRNYMSPDKEMKGMINDIGDASAIVHPLQREAVARGIGKYKADLKIY